MSIKLTPELEEFVQQELAAGEYRSAEEVVSEALRLLRKKREFDALKAEVQIGLDQVARGEVGPWDPEAVQEEIRRRMRVRGQEV